MKTKNAARVVNKEKLLKSSAVQLIHCCVNLCRPSLVHCVSYYSTATMDVGLLTGDGWLLKAVANECAVAAVGGKLLVWRYLSLNVQSSLRCRCCQQNCRPCPVDHAQTPRAFPTNYPIGEASKASEPRLGYLVS